VLVATVIKLLILVIWYRVKLTNSPVHTKAIFGVGLISDLIISVLVIFYATHGVKVEDEDLRVKIPVWQATAQILFQALVHTLVWVFCVIRAYLKVVKLTKTTDATTSKDFSLGH